MFVSKSFSRVHNILQLGTKQFVNKSVYNIFCTFSFLKCNKILIYDIFMSEFYGKKRLNYVSGESVWKKRLNYVRGKSV